MLISVVAGAGVLVGSGIPPAPPVDEDRTLIDENAETDEQTLAVEDTGTDDRLLLVEDAETGEQLLAVPVTEETTVALNYTHSVEKTPVLDVYEVNGTELEMVRMEFHSYGAGLPARADVNVTENGTFVFDPDGSYDTLYVTPGRIAGHELIVGDRRYDLVDLSDGRSVSLRIVHRSTVTTEPESHDNSSVVATETEHRDDRVEERGRSRGAMTEPRNEDGVEEKRQLSRLTNSRHSDRHPQIP